MAGWSKPDAIRELRHLSGICQELEEEFRGSENHTRFVLGCATFLEEVFGPSSRFFQSFGGLRWRETGSVVVGGPADPAGSLDPVSAMNEKHQEAYVRDLGSARGILLAAADHLERRDIDTVYEGKDSGPESSTILKVLKLCEFRLRKVIRERPEKESEVQNALESLLIGAEIPYSREKDNIEYSSKTYIPDFTMPKIDLAIDVKLCATRERERAIIAEINDDILAYQTKYGNVLFVVYDTGFIRDVERFAGNFEQLEHVMVRVVKH